MRVSLKKTLATVLSVALVLSTCLCALTVGAAATVVGRIDISDNENVVPGESFEVPATITLDAASQFVEVAFTLDLPEGFTLNSAAAEDSSVAEVSISAGDIIRVSAVDSVDSIGLVMTISTTLADFEPFNLGVAKVEYADVSEADLTLDITDTGLISIKANHAATDNYAFDENNHWNTCAEAGCDEKFNEAAHTWVAGEKVDATCTAAGSQVYSCVCGATKTEEIAILEHVAGEAVKENEVLATCTTPGSYDMVTYCTVGGEELSRETVEVPVTDHTPLEAAKENEVAATCAAAGSYDMVVRCAECGEVISSESFVIEALAHEYQYADNGDGNHTKTCKNCDTVNVVEAHSYVDGTCVCGIKSGPELYPALGTTCLSKESMTIDNKINFRYEFGFRVDGKKLDFDAVTFEFKKPKWDSNYNFIEGEYNTSTLTDADNQSKYGAAGIYVFEYNDIQLNEMSLKITATITLWKEGVAKMYYTFDPVSLADKAQKLYNESLAGDDTKNLKMSVDILNMGTAFQNFFADKGDNLDVNINAGKQCDFASLPIPNVLNAETGETVDQQYASDVRTLTDTNVIRDSAFQIPTIETLDTLVLSYQFRVATFTTPSKVTITSSYDSIREGSLSYPTIASDLPPEYLSRAEKYGIYKYTFNKVAFYDLDKLVTVTATDGTTTVTYQISLLSKITDMLGTTTGLSYENFKAMAAFAASCKAYWPDY